MPAEKREKKNGINTEVKNVLQLQHPSLHLLLLFFFEPEAPFQADKGEQRKWLVLVLFLRESFHPTCIRRTEVLYPI